VTTGGTAAEFIALGVDKATSLTFDNAQELTVTGLTMPLVTTMTAEGSGALNLGDVSANPLLTSINAASATGGVTATIDGDSQSFTGGSGNDVVTVDVSFQLSKAIDGGGGSNEVILTNAASFYNPIINPTGPISADFTNFQTLGLAGAGAGGTYDVSGFTAVDVDTDNTLDLINAGAGETLAITTTNLGGIEWNLKTDTKANSLSVAVGVDGVTDVGIFVSELVTSAGSAGSIQTVTVNSVGEAVGGAVGPYEHVLFLRDANATTAGGTTTLNVTGDAAILVVDGDATITTITATDSQTVNVSNVSDNVKGMTVTGGAGQIIVDFDNNNGVTTLNTVDVATTGSGGGVITLGTGTSAGGTGSETVNLGASSAVRDTIVAEVTPGAAGNGTQGIISGFALGTAASPGSSDVLDLGGTPTIIANLTTATAGAVSGSTYTISDGAFTLVHAAAGLTGAEELADVQAFLDAAGAGAVGAVSVAGTTYVIEASAAGGNADTILQLTGASGVTGFGLADDVSTGDVGMGGGSTISLTDVSFANVSATNGGSNVANEAFNDAGIALDTLTAGATGFTSTYSNMGNFAELDASAATGGNVVVTQVGAAPELYVKAIGDFTLDSLTYGGNIVLDANAGDITIKSLVSSGNADATISLSGTGGENITVDAVTDTGLTTIDATHTDGLVTLADVSALTQAGLTITGSTGGGTLDLGLNTAGVFTGGASGAGDHITGSDFGADLIVAGGAGDVIVDGTGSNVIAANGAGDTITDGGNAAGYSNTQSIVIHASGAGDTITLATTATNGGAITFDAGGSVEIDGGSATAGVGANSTISLGNGTATEAVVVTGALTGATSAGTPAMVTLSNAHTDGTDVVVFNNATNETLADSTAGHTNQVNVANTATLGAALDLAAATAAMSQQSGLDHAGSIAAHTGVIDWFQWGGNTYVVEAINATSAAATHTALAVGDAVVKLTGLVDLTHATITGHDLTL
jgi:hypothetical protein